MTLYHLLNKLPDVLKELMDRDDKEFWLQAMDREIKSINRNNTWKQVIKPKSAEIIDTKWVYAFKPLEKIRNDKYKARLVVRGFAQQDTFNYDEIYSPVARMSTLRTLLAIGNQYDYYFIQLDVRTAFLNGHIKEDIYIHPPDGVNCKKGHVLKLNRSLYGLKQASKCWNDRINTFLLNLRFVRSENDYCLYSKICEGGTVYLLIYVDDIIISGPNLELINIVKIKLTREFEMKDKGELKYFLGLEIDYNRKMGILKINQRRYAMGILKRFGLENCKPCPTPIDHKLKLTTLDKNEDETDKPVRELIGCLMYLMLGTRPDISYAINYFSRYQDRARNETWVYLKRLLRYVKESIDLSLVYKRRKVEKPLICYVDSDWGGDLVDRKSVSGSLIKVFGNTVAWSTKKQNTVALSTAEAELIALCNSVQDGLWFKKLLNDLNIKIDEVVILEDNQGCIALIKNPENNRRVKHIDIKYNFVCDHIKKGNVNVKYICSKDQEADILTKGLPKPVFRNLRHEMGLLYP